jgi:hypothetical protein
VILPVRQNQQAATILVMVGLDPAIHVLLEKKNVDARVKPAMTD